MAFKVRVLFWNIATCDASWCVSVLTRSPNIPSQNPETRNQNKQVTIRSKGSLSSVRLSLTEPGNSNWVTKVFIHLKELWWVLSSVCKQYFKLSWNYISPSKQWRRSHYNQCILLLSNCELFVWNIAVLMNFWHETSNRLGWLAGRGELQLNSYINE